jgi:hypothetical protein
MGYNRIQDRIFDMAGDHLKLGFGTNYGPCVGRDTSGVVCAHRDTPQKIVQWDDDKPRFRGT